MQHQDPDPSLQLRQIQRCPNCRRHLVLTEEGKCQECGVQIHSSSFSLTVPGFTYLGRLDEIDESHDFLLENFEIHIRCSECASMATILEDEVLTCLCKRVKVDLVEGLIDRMEGDWLIYVKNE